MDRSTFAEPQMKECPFCAELIQPRAIKCRFCGEFLTKDRLKRLARTSKDNADTDENEATAEQQEDQEEDEILFEGRPSLFSLAWPVLKGSFFIAIAYLLIRFPVDKTLVKLFGLSVTDAQFEVLTRYRLTAGYGLIALVCSILSVSLIRLRMTWYEVTPDRIEWSRGILDRRVDNLDMFRVVDLNLHRTLFDILVGIGTVELETTDKSTPKFIFSKVRHCRRLYDDVKKASLEADRTTNVVHLE